MSQTSDIDPAEVAAFIASNNQGAAEAPVAGVAVELPPDALGILNADKEEAHNPTRTTIPLDPDLQPTSLPPSDPWSREDRTLGTVTASPMERDAYFRAALFEQEIAFEIQIHGVRLLIRDLSGYENQVLSAALVLDQQDSAFRFNSEQLIFRSTLYKMALMVKTVNDTPHIHYVCFDPASSNDPMISAVVLREAVKKFEATLHPARHSLLLAALRVFDIKLNICHEGFANGDFIRPGGIA